MKVSLAVLALTSSKALRIKNKLPPPILEGVVDDLEAKVLAAGGHSTPNLEIWQNFTGPTITFGGHGGHHVQSNSGEYEEGDPICPGCWDCDDIGVITNELVNYYDDNNDGVLDHNDGHDVQEIIDYCDTNGDAMLHIGEIYECVVYEENLYRESAAPDAEDLDCVNPYGEYEAPTPPPTCDGHWTCEDVQMITEEVFAYVDTNNDGIFNNHDDGYHDMQEGVDMCDQNGDGALNYYEIYACIVDWENEWRDEACPDFGDLTCVNPYEQYEFVQEDSDVVNSGEYSSDDPICPYCWNCEDIHIITQDLALYLDTNNDGIFDDYDSEYHNMGDLVELCDQNGDAALHYHEIYDCIVDLENEYRADAAPDAEDLVCENPYGQIVDFHDCDGCWSCEDVYYISAEILNYYDGNNDGFIDYNDGSEHEISEIIEMCDQNGDEVVSSPEVFNCVVDLENDWRAEYSPEGTPDLYCENPFA